MFLVLNDAHSEWIEAFCSGTPETVVTNNGTCFVSAEFENFLAINEIRHITSAPYHHATNGLAESCADCEAWPKKVY